jgi:ribonuclease Y
MILYFIAVFLGIVVGIIVGIPVGIQQRKNAAEREIGSAEDEAKRIVNEAYKSAESKKT